MQTFIPGVERIPYFLCGLQLKRKANNSGHLRRWYTSLLKADVYIILKFLLKFLYFCKWRGKFSRNLFVECH